MPVRSDSFRLNWLESQIVEVRQPLRYGSKPQFYANPTQHDAEADHDSTLRELIDEAMDAEAAKERASASEELVLARARAEAEGDSAVGAGTDLWSESFVAAVRKLTFQARTSGGTAGRDEGLCAALDAVEALLPPVTP